MLLYWNLTRCRILGQFFVNLDLLLCTGFDSNMLTCINALFRLNKAIRGASVCDKFSRKIAAKSIENFYSHEKQNSVVTAQKFTKHQTFLTLELSLSQAWYHFSWGEPVAACSDCCRLGNALFVLDCPIRQSSANLPNHCHIAPPRARPLTLKSKPSIVVWNSQAGAQIRLTLGFSMPLGNFNQILIVENLTKFSTSRGLTIFPEPPLA